MVKLKHINPRKIKTVEIQTLSKADISNSKISKKLNVSKTTVAKWINRRSVVDKMKGRPPKKIDYYTKSIIEKHLKMTVLYEKLLMY